MSQGMHRKAHAAMNDEKGRNVRGEAPEKSGSRCAG